MVRVEFTIEPFVEGRPGPHVTAAIEAARDLLLGAAGGRGGVDVGPFGTSCRVEPPRAGALVAAVTDAAVANGATHVSLHVERVA